jgi:branched-subunit amino acid permease
MNRTGIGEMIMEEFLVEVALLALITTAIGVIICVADYFEKRSGKGNA